MSVILFIGTKECEETMRSYVRYQMYGFNKKDDTPDNNGKASWAVTLKDNKEYTYKDHHFLHSVYIDEHITSIKFTLKDGLSCKYYREEISMELERIAFNIISKVGDLPIYMPVCELVEAVDYDGTNCNIEVHDRIKVIDTCFIAKNIDASGFYETCIESKNELLNQTGKYKELFYVLHSPHKITQFIALYDIMADLIYNSGKNQGKPHVQAMICDFFEKYSDRYDGMVKIEKSITKNKHGNDVEKKEDTFTKTRNQIAHCRDRGIKEFTDLDKRLTFTGIRNLLTIINDLICKTVEP